MVSLRSPTQKFGNHKEFVEFFQLFLVEVHICILHLLVVNLTCPVNFKRDLLNQEQYLRPKNAQRGTAEARREESLISLRHSAKPYPAISSTTILYNRWFLKSKEQKSRKLNL